MPSEYTHSPKRRKVIGRYKPLVYPKTMEFIIVDDHVRHPTFGEVIAGASPTPGPSLVHHLGSNGIWKQSTR